MNFGDICDKTVEMPDCFRLFGPKGPPSVGIGLKEMKFKVTDLVYYEKNKNFDL